MPDPPACNLALATMPPELATWLATLKGRVTTTLRSAVLRLCAWTPLTVEQLATLLAKDRHYRGQSQFGLGCVTDDPHEYSFTNDKRLLGDGTNLSSVLHRLWGADADAGTEPFATQRAAILAFIQRRPEQDIAGLGFLDGPRGEVMVQLHETFGGTPTGCEAPRRAVPPPRAPAPAPKAPAAKSSTGFDDMDDDIPFCSRLLAVGIQRRRPAWAAGRTALKIERAPDRAAALRLEGPATPAHTPSSAP